MIKILFVCHGNICRSTIAEFVMKHLVRENGVAEQFEIASAAMTRDAIGCDTHSGTKEVLRAHNIEVTPRRAVLMTKADYKYYDLVVVMDKENLWDMKRLIGKDTDGKVHLLLEYAGRPGQEVADPWYTGNFEATYKDVMQGCQGLLQILK